MEDWRQVALQDDRRFDFEGGMEPRGDQPRAIAELTEALAAGRPAAVLLGVTGSGKTYTMARVIEATGRPALVMAHNKTLAAQLYKEFQSFFPHNAVEYFVSYYDYYQPEAYVPATDTYIDKDASINDEIDRLRHSATRSLFVRRDVIVVASVSCIYGLGSPESYYGMVLVARPGQELPRRRLLRQLVEMQYERNDVDFHRGTFRVRGDVVEVFPPYAEEALRIELFGDEVERVRVVDPLRGTTLRDLPQLALFPNSHYVTPGPQLQAAMVAIRDELAGRLAELKAAGKLLEVQRLQERTLYDLEMMELMGYCAGIENYARHLAGRAAGEPPPTLLDFLPPDALVFIDESHQTVPQLRAMYRGDRSRKEVLVDYGFRLPSALDNRPLAFEEFERRAGQVVFVSATPAAYELARADGLVAQQVIRPTGLMDPEVEVRPARGQVDDLLGEIRTRAAAGQRVLATTLTKRMAEDLASYYADLGVRVRYLHSEVHTLQRFELIRDLRLGKFDVLVGINLLREGLDIPEVSLVAILDADKEGFLRSNVSLIQTIGRAARHLDGRAILYADRVTASMAAALDETRRRRELQLAYNREHGITPESVRKEIRGLLASVEEADYVTVPAERDPVEIELETAADPAALIAGLEARMHEHARALEYEAAARLRDRVRQLKRNLLVLE